MPCRLAVIEVPWGDDVADTGRTGLEEDPQQRLARLRFKTSYSKPVALYS